MRRARESPAQDTEIRVQAREIRIQRVEIRVRAPSGPSIVASSVGGIACGSTAVEDRRREMFCHAAALEFDIDVKVNCSLRWSAC
ncbi:hypothetical protein BAY61_25530 [Prauserella marina]|nr:hypothetical protein BAY61_25530 [Prauserella marina]